MSENYVEIMIQSLRKKVSIMDIIIDLDEEQKSLLEDPKLTPEEFDEIVEKKSDMIEQLIQLDKGFEKLFARMVEELELNKDYYRDQILEMKSLIRLITDKSMEIQVQEARNKDLMTLKFDRIKSSARNVRKGAEAVTKYYKSMSGTGFVESQFWDQKK